MSIGERILELRKNQNISQADLADSMGVSRQAVSKWESDKSSPDTIKLIQLAEVLNTEVEFLATGRHPVYQSPDIHVTLVKKPDKVIEKIVEKPVEHVVERVVEKPFPVVRIRYKYRNDPIVLGAAAIGGLILGIILGLLI